MGSFNRDSGSIPLALLWVLDRMVFRFSPVHLMPTFRFVLLDLRFLRAVPSEMAIFMAASAFKRKLFIVELLEVSPIPHCQFDSFRKASLKVHFHTNTGTGVLVLRACRVNVFPQDIPDGSERVGILAVHWEVRETDPDWDSFGNVRLRIKVRGPSIEIEALRPHEIRPVPED